MIAKGEGIHDTADRLCREAEAIVPNMACSILTVDRAGRLHTLAAPSLPDSYSSVLEGVAIGPTAGSCGTAAYLHESVTVEDIASDPLWDDYRHLILPLGYRACWSTPIIDGGGTILGTFAFYYRQCRGPSAAERDLVDACIHLCVIALERHDRVLERERMAHADGLTGLANRACFNAALDALDCTQAGAWALLAIDLDNLKVVNDTFGHHAGDILLRTVASRLADAAAPDRAFRLGGDEFAVIVHAPSNLYDMEGYANAILERLIPPVECAGHTLYPRATMGGAILSPTDHLPDNVRQNADYALYHAKETGRGGFVRYWPGLGTSITQRLSAIQAVGAALKDGRIDAYYQPVLRLDTGEIVGVEALCRMTTTEGRVCSAAEFYEATTDATIARILTDTMLAKVARDVRDWLAMGMAFQHVGLNVSSADFYRPVPLHEHLSAGFAKEGVPLHHLIVEVTEGVYLDDRDNSIGQQIEAMRHHGLKVALDDFGTGFASLTHLLTVPVDIIKIDKSFVARLVRGGASAAIIEGLSLIANKLGMRLLAEGIEQEAQARQLCDFGCIIGQGFLYSPAVHRAEMTDLLLHYAQGTGRSLRAAAHRSSSSPAMALRGRAG
ncbi:EAL domain-containing protein [Sphingobium sp. CR2-8]|uniref:sensor domain-containing phosphodiesterase n=1 Tax=Sphingobium sp. CR2-8 TaxID=1306534 RepID=UPI002DBD5A99|nr:EAL domain-containing protein [Sphingobium sp. CR2-8]MEC3909373.1 EAL domain-containing protein [Sphingobium sp. CR2-8]